MSLFTARSQNHRGRLETLEARQLMAADLGADLATIAPEETDYVVVGTAAPDSPVEEAAARASDSAEYEPALPIVADSFSFGVEREMKESGEKGGTEDINIGVGELQECTISKSMDMAAAVDEAMADAEPICYLKYKLDRAFIKSWSVSGDADDRPTEEVSFYYNKIAFAYSMSPDAEDFDSPMLAQYAINGNSPGTAEIDFVEVAGGGDADDRPTEEVAFYYNKIAFNYASTADGKE